MSKLFRQGRHLHRCLPLHKATSVGGTKPNNEGEAGRSGKTDAGWRAWAGASSVVAALAWAYCTDTGTVWLECGAALGKRFECEKKPGDMRRIIEEKAEKLREYVLNFDKKKKGSFYVVLGPEASGKTSVIKQAFAGWQGVCFIEVSLDPESVDKIRFPKVLAKHFGILKDVPYAWVHACRESVDKIDDYCRYWKGHPLVVIISLKSDGKQISSEQAAVLAGKILDFARTYTHDQPTCPVIFETSVPMIGDKVTSRFGGICRALYMLPMNLSEFKDVALERIAKEGTWEKLKVTEKCTTPGAALEKLKACMKDPTGEGKEVNDLLEEYYLKVGSDVRRLQGLIAGKREKRTFAEEIEMAHDELKKRLESLTDGEKQLVPKLIAAGPRGYLTLEDDDTTSKLTLLARAPSDTLARTIYDCITLHYVGHVYALLMQEHNDDAQVRALMKQYGWVDMTEPVQASSA